MYFGVAVRQEELPPVVVETALDRRRRRSSIRPAPPADDQALEHVAGVEAVHPVEVRALAVGPRAVVPLAAPTVYATPASAASRSPFGRACCASSRASSAQTSMFALWIGVRSPAR